MKERAVTAETVVFIHNKLKDSILAYAFEECIACPYIRLSAADLIGRCYRMDREVTVLDSYHPAKRSSITVREMKHNLTRNLLCNNHTCNLTEQERLFMRVFK